MVDSFCVLTSTGVGIVGGCWGCCCCCGDGWYGGGGWLFVIPLLSVVKIWFNKSSKFCCWHSAIDAQTNKMNEILRILFCFCVWCIWNENRYKISTNQNFCPSNRDYDNGILRMERSKNAIEFISTIKLDNNLTGYECNFRRDQNSKKSKIPCRIIVLIENNCE